MPKTAKKKAAKKSGRKSNTAMVTNADIFEIEETPPPPRFRGITPEMTALKEKIARTMERLKPGQAFVVPAEHRASVRKFLTSEYPEKNILTSAVTGNDAVIRIYLRKPV